MKNFLKKYCIVALALILSFFAVNSQAATVFDNLTAAISFGDLVSALGVVYVGMITVALFIIGGRKIMGMLGFSAYR